LRDYQLGALLAIVLGIIGTWSSWIGWQGYLAWIKTYGGIADLYLSQSAQLARFYQADGYQILGVFAILAAFIVGIISIVVWKD